ncbi:hypothetical protein BJ981_002277 [Sphaerisporangium krabiense]|uniref:Uncharacterized protein n=1 Tax=Sphaerisporangium krabiense TaxID=763782 RepID=A0A7W8Z3X1_9ACTN|nr:hypothetical protein [Sphaerisporangium krabiense]
MPRMREEYVSERFDAPARAAEATVAMIPGRRKAVGSA